jgi:hypothetical protein
MYQVLTSYILAGFRTHDLFNMWSRWPRRHGVGPSEPNLFKMILLNVYGNFYETNVTTIYVMKLWVKMGIGLEYFFSVHFLSITICTNKNIRKKNIDPMQIARMLTWLLQGRRAVQEYRGGFLDALRPLSRNQYRRSVQGSDRCNSTKKPEIVHKVAKMNAWVGCIRAS